MALSIRDGAHIPVGVIPISLCLLEGILPTGSAKEGVMRVGRAPSIRVGHGEQIAVRVIGDERSPIGRSGDQGQTIEDIIREPIQPITVTHLISGGIDLLALNGPPNPHALRWSLVRDSTKVGSICVIALTVASLSARLTTVTVCLPVSDSKNAAYSWSSASGRSRYANNI